MKSSKLVFIPLIILVILGAIYVAGGMYFSNHFYLNSTINGVKASGRSAQTVEDAITEAATGYQLDIEDEGRGTTYTIFASDVGMKTDVSMDEVDEILKKQNGFLWPLHIIERTEYETDHVVMVDKELLKKEIEALPCVDAADIVHTEDAKYELQTDHFVIVPEVFGTDIDVDGMVEKVEERMSCLHKSMGLMADQCYVQPEVLSDDAELVALVDDLNDHMAANITFTLDKDTPIDKETQASFLKVKNGKVSYDKSAIEAYVSELAKSVNTFGQNKEFKTSYGEEIIVPGGTYGWKVDEAAEVDAIIADLDKGEDVSRELHYMYYANSHGKHDYGKTYVEVNLTAQHLFLYKDGELVLESDVVTGNPSRGNGTHVGAYFVAYKEKDATLRGDNYETPVSYWMPFHGNEGMHDATWRSSFGGTIYKYNGSHGCVNCPFQTAKTIFETIDEGCPVLVYELEGTESSKDEQNRAQAVINSINSIGEVTLESENAIIAARQSYDALSDTAKSFVKNIGILEEAERTIATLKEQAPETEETVTEGEGEAANEDEAAAEDTEKKSKKNKKKKKND